MLLCMRVALASGLVSVAFADGNRLRITNGCEREPLWIAHMAAATIGPDAQDVKIEPNAFFEFSTPPGLTATRYWPKMGCDENGHDCTLGGSGGPGEHCVRKHDDYSRCAPPIDTKFEGTFGSQSLPCQDGVGVEGCDYVDVSLVDGWTLPFVLKIVGQCVGTKGPTTDLTLDCSGLTFDQCPQYESLTAANGLVTDLRAVNPRTDQVAGCYAPCQKLVSEKWNNSESNGRFQWDQEVAPYCCPTPPETPEACRSGAMIQTEFLKTVHRQCPGVYGYAYDDGMGLLRCSPFSIYELIFSCPDEHTNFKATADARRKAREAEDRKAKLAEEAKARAEQNGPHFSKSKNATLDKSVEKKQALQRNKKAISVKAVDLPSAILDQSETASLMGNCGFWLLCCVGPLLLVTSVVRISKYRPASRSFVAGLRRQMDTEVVDNVRISTSGSCRALLYEQVRGQQ